MIVHGSLSQLLGDCPYVDGNVIGRPIIDKCTPGIERCIGVITSVDGDTWYGEVDIPLPEAPQVSFEMTTKNPSFLPPDDYAKDRLPRRHGRYPWGDERNNK